MAGQRHRRRGRHLPAGLRGAGHRRGIDPQKQQRHARFLGSERKTATGGQVQLAHGAPAFHNHRAQGRAAQTLHSRAHQRQGIGQHADQPLARPPPQVAPALGLNHAPQPRGPPRSQPQHRARPAGKARGQAHGKPAGRRRIIDLCPINLMHPRARQSADQSFQQGQTETAGERFQLRRTMADRKGDDSHVHIMFYFLERSSRLSPACSGFPQSYPHRRVAGYGRGRTHAA